MAATVGRNGNFKVSTNAVGLIDSWTLNGTIETADITAYGNNSRRRAQTIRDWSVEATGTFDRSDAQQAALVDLVEDGTLGNTALRLYTATASFWSGNALLTGVTVNSNVGDKVSLTLSFQANGDLAFTSS